MWRILAPCTFLADSSFGIVHFLWNRRALGARRRWVWWYLCVLSKFDWTYWLFLTAIVVSSGSTVSCGLCHCSSPCPWINQWPKFSVVQHFAYKVTTKPSHHLIIYIFLNMLMSCNIYFMSVVASCILNQFKNWLNAHWVSYLVILPCWAPIGDTVEFHNQETQSWWLPTYSLCFLS